MNRDNYSFRGLDEVERELRVLDEGATHILLQDRTEPGTDVTVGRLDLTEAATRPWLTLIDQERYAGLPLRRALGLGASHGVPPPDEEDDDNEEDDQEGEFDGEEEADDEAPAERVARQERGAVATRLSRKDIMEVACWWVRELAIRNTFAESHRRFRVRVYGNKGGKSYYCGQFLCQNLEHRQQMEPPPVTHQHTQAPTQQPLPVLAAAPVNPPPPVELRAEPITRRPTTAEQEGVSVGMRALGDYYAQYGQLLLGSVTRLQALSDNVLSRLDHHLQESRDQLDQVLAALVEKRFAEATLAENKATEEKESAQKHKLVDQSFATLGDVVKAMFISKGMSPQAHALLDVLSKNPELAEALQNPDVKRLMEDRNNMKDLANTLVQVSRMPREQAGDPPAGRGGIGDGALPPEAAALAQMAPTSGWGQPPATGMVPPPNGPYLVPIPGAFNGSLQPSMGFAQEPTASTPPFGAPAAATSLPTAAWQRPVPPGRRSILSTFQPPGEPHMPPTPESVPPQGPPGSPMRPPGPPRTTGR